MIEEYYYYDCFLYEYWPTHKVHEGKLEKTWFLSSVSSRRIHILSSFWIDLQQPLRCAHVLLVECAEMGRRREILQTHSFNACNTEEHWFGDHFLSLRSDKFSLQPMLLVTLRLERSLQQEATRVIGSIFRFFSSRFVLKHDFFATLRLHFFLKCCRKPEFSCDPVSLYKKLVGA